MDKILRVITTFCLDRYLMALGICLLCSFSCLSQTRGYIVKGDTAYTQGKIKYDRKNADKIIFYSGRHQMEYDANQVTKFGFKDSTQYFSKKIIINNASKNTFLELLEDGQLDLYRYRNNESQLYLEDDSLISLNSDNFKNVLREYAESHRKWNEQYLLLKPKKKPLSFFVRNYNANKNVNIPFTNFGFLFGYSFSTIKLSQDSYSQSNFGTVQMQGKNINFGSFIELPIWKINNLTFVSQLTFSRVEFVKELLSSTLNHDVKLDVSHLSLQLSPKYTLNTKTVRPYFLLGGAIDYTLQSESEIFQATIENDIITFDEVEGNIEIPKYFYGLVYGLGFHYYYKYNHYVSLEIGDSYLFSNNSTNQKKLSIMLKMNL